MNEPPADEKPERVQVALEGGPQGRGHPILVLTVAVPSR